LRARGIGGITRCAGDRDELDQSFVGRILHKLCFEVVEQLLAPRGRIVQHAASDAGNWIGQDPLVHERSQRTIRLYEGESVPASIRHPRSPQGRFSQKSPGLDGTGRFQAPSEVLPTAL